MKTFKIPVWEQVKIWAMVDIVVEAESEEDAMKQLTGNDVKILDITITEYNTETEEHLGWDFGYVTLDDIEEVV